MNLAPTVRLLILTFLATWLEISLLVFGLHAGAALWAIVAVLGSYHLGYLGADLVRVLPARARVAFALAGGVSLVAGVARGDLLLVGLGIAPFASFLQATRRELKPIASMRTARKDAAKLVAMALATAALLPTAIVVALFSTAVGVVVFCAVPWPQAMAAPAPAFVEGNSNLLWFELLHHAHYFAYCYAFWALIPSTTVAIGPLFVLGWIGYIVLESWRPRWSRSRKIALMAIGHALCAVALVLMLQGGLAMVLASWTLTGFAGGTAYMLGLLPQSPKRERYEDVGHVLGCALAAVVLLVAPAPTGAVGLGAALAVLAAVTLLPVIRTARTGANVSAAAV